MKTNHDGGDATRPEQQRAAVRRRFIQRTSSLRLSAQPSGGGICVKLGHFLQL